MPLLESEILELTLPSSMDYLSLINGVVEEICDRIEAEEAARDVLTTSVIEACTNAIEHGNREDVSKVVRIRFLYNSSRLEVFVSDQGAGFDLENVASPVEPENLLRERGRGIFILKSFMDEVNYKYQPSSGTTVHLVKNLDDTAEAAQ